MKIDEKSDKEVMIAFDKFSCGDSEEPVLHGHFEFTGFMNSNDFFRSGIVGYNLRNKNDAIRVIYSYKDEYEFLPKKTVFLFPNDFNGLPLLELTETINL